MIHDSLVDKLAKLAIERGWEEDTDNDIVSVEVEGTSYDPRLGSILSFLSRKLPKKRHYDLSNAVNVDVYTDYDMVQYTIVQGDGSKEEQENDLGFILGVL